MFGYIIFIAVLSCFLFYKIKNDNNNRKGE